MWAYLTVFSDNLAAVSLPPYLVSSPSWRYSTRKNWDRWRSILACQLIFVCTVETTSAELVPGTASSDHVSSAWYRLFQRLHNSLYLVQVLVISSPLPASGTTSPKNTKLVPGAASNRSALQISLFLRSLLCGSYFSSASPWQSF